jgi:indolepyruvate ferredoxin oxidoreductase
VRRIALPAAVIPIEQHFSRNLDELVERRVQFLTGYQDAAYADRYRSLVLKVRKLEQEKIQSTKLAEAVARYYAKLLAYKDEYEVARLYTDGAFRRKIEGMFEGDYKLVYHLAPPLIAKPDARTGEPAKIAFGGWVLHLFKVLSKFKGLRGTPFDVFGRTDERRAERALIAEYEQTVEALLAGLARDNHGLALEIASLPESIRGYGHIKAKSIAGARAKRDELLARYRTAPVRAAA